MSLQCNIDARGKFARLVWGFIVLLAGVLLAIFRAWPGHSPLAWTLSALLVLAGAFALFESWAGWCVMRAMGFKTRM